MSTGQRTSGGGVLVRGHPGGRRRGHVDVDDEGGTVSSAIRPTVRGNHFATGKGTNEYVHPKGFECRWNMTVLFTRERDEEE